MNSFWTLLFYSLITLNLSCKSDKDSKMKTFAYDLSAHPGTKNYEILMLSPNKRDKALKLLYDTANKFIVLYCVDYIKISNYGYIIDSISEGGIGYHTNGIMQLHSDISEWLINGNRLFVPTIDIPPPLGNGFEDFDRDYKNAEYYFRQNGFPVFKINGKWVQYITPVPIELMRYLRSDEGQSKYPEKPKGRFIPMPKVGPDLGITPKERDTSLLKSLGYVPVDVKKENWGLSSHNYSAGFYNMEIYMPGGDTIQFRHFGSLGPDIRLYRVPEKYGGRKDILFVTQDYNYLYPEQSVGGVYVIRPRKL